MWSPAGAGRHGRGIPLPEEAALPQQGLRAFVPGVDPLSGRTIVITRPEGAADRLCRRLCAIGARVLLAPAVDIVPGPDADDLPALLRPRVAEGDGFDLALFVSPTAVLQTFARLGGPWPVALPAAAVGRATARRLLDAGVDAIAPLEGADAEALLAHPRLGRVAGQRLAILKGVGGRGLLERELCARGAQVRSFDVYRRRRPGMLPPSLGHCLDAGGPDAITITSSEILDNLLALAGNARLPRLRQVPAFVIHPRIAGHARAAGMQRVVAVADATDDAMVTDMVRWFAEISGKSS